MSINQTAFDSIIKKSDSFGEDIKKLQNIFEALQRKKDDILRREQMLQKEKDELSDEETKLKTNMLSILQNLFSFHKEAMYGITDLYKRALAEANFRTQAEAAQRALAENAQKALSEAAQRAKAEAEFRLQADAAQRKLFEQTVKAQAEAAERIQFEIGKTSSIKQQPMERHQMERPMMERPMMERQQMAPEQTPHIASYSVQKFPNPKPMNMPAQTMIEKQEDFSEVFELDEVQDNNKKKFFPVGKKNKNFF
ncbi:MAG: hypothetical protein JW795_06040 [Chitinivibrionales bacterium]|nr:hypothetical protein [Chitinivibrionales bacterium]